MAPFQFQPPPRAASLADLIMAPGLAQARAAEQIGAAQAQAALQSGQAWGQAISNIGQTIGALPQQIQQQRRDVATQALLDLKLREAQRDERSTAIFEAALKNPAFYKPDGQTDDDKIMNYLKQNDVGAWQHWNAISQANLKNKVDTQKALIDIQNAQLTGDEKRRAAVQARTDYLGKLAYEGERLLNVQPSDPLHARDTRLAAVARAAADGMVSEPEARDFLMQTAGATPEQMRQVFASFVPRDLRAAFEKEAVEQRYKAAQAAESEAKAKQISELGGTTPEEQYLHAVITGNKTLQAQIFKTMQDKAMASRDPQMQALVEQLRQVNVETARQRLADMQRKAEPVDIEPDIQTTTAGRRYLDLSGYQGEERNKARKAAGEAGVIGVSKEQANALQEIDNARANQRDILNQIQDLLPRGAAGRPLAAVTTTLGTLFQTNDQVAAFNSWRTAAIQTLRATAGSKGLRINQAEIAQAIENDIPRLTDTVGTARQKVENINRMLENAERSILVRDRSVVTPPTSVTPPLNPRLPKF